MEITDALTDEVVCGGKRILTSIQYIKYLITKKRWGGGAKDCCPPLFAYENK